MCLLVQNSCIFMNLICLVIGGEVHNVWKLHVNWGRMKGVSGRCIKTGRKDELYFGHKIGPVYKNLPPKSNRY